MDFEYWVIWRDGMFIFGSIGVMFVNEMGQLFFKPASRLFPLMLIILDFGTCCCFNFFTSVFLAEWFARCFSLF